MLPFTSFLYSRDISRPRCWWLIYNNYCSVNSNKWVYFTFISVDKIKLPETEALACCVVEVRQLLQKILSDIRPHEVLKNVDRIFIDNKGNIICATYLVLDFNLYFRKALGTVESVRLQIDNLYHNDNFSRNWS